MAPLWVNIFRLAIWLVVLTAVFVPLERFLPVKRRATERGHKSTDVALYFVNNVLPNLLLAIPLAAVAWAAHRVLSVAWMETIAGLPLFLRLVCTVAVGEVGSYWGHRVAHEIPLLWRFHSVHHEPEEVDWLVNSHAHPFDVAFQRLCGLAPLYLIGLAQPMAESADIVPLVSTLVGSLWSFFIHSNIRVRLGPLEYLLSTPAFHHWHHARDEAARNRNYAALLPCVDGLFGTLHLPERKWPEGYGTEAPPHRGLVNVLLRPFTS